MVNLAGFYIAAGRLSEALKLGEESLTLIQHSNEEEDLRRAGLLD